MLAPQTVLPSSVAFQRTEKRGAFNGQIERLRNYAHDHGRAVENTYTDVGGCIDADRRGFDSLLDNVQDVECGRVLVTSEDRLARFGF